jgi:hypothetical protein
MVDTAGGEAMKRLRSLLIVPLAAALLCTSGCIFFRSASISDSAGKGSAITGQASDNGYLVLIPPGNVTQAAADQLVGQCPSGKVTDVQTELTVRDFFFIVQMYQANANGVCL